MATTIQPEIPWNVAGIAPEARDAARTSARREGLSVGEWLTRRILRSQPVTAAASDEWWLAENGQSRTPSNENPVRFGHQRSEDRLGVILQRTNEVRHTGTKTVPGDAAATTKHPARSSSDNTEKLSERIVHLDARLARVEIRAASEEAKNAEAIKTLQAKITALTDQISRTAARGVAQDAQLAKAIEAVTGKFLLANSGADERSSALDTRITTIAEDVASVGEKLDAARDDGERQLRGFEDRVVAMECTVEAARRDGHEVERLSGSLGDLTRRFEASETEYLNNVERFEGRLTRIEANSADAKIDRRLQGIEQTLADMARLIERSTPEKSVAADAPEQRPDSQLDAAMLRNSPPSLGAAAATPILDLPPFPEKPTSGFAPPPDSAPPPVEDLRATQQTPPLFDQSAKRSIPPEVEQFLAAARRNARNGDSMRPRSTFSWVDPVAQKKAEATHTRLILLGALGLVVLAAIGTGFYLSNSLPRPLAAPHIAVGATPSDTKATSEKPTQTAMQSRVQSVTTPRPAASQLNLKAPQNAARAPIAPASTSTATAATDSLVAPKTAVRPPPAAAPGKALTPQQRLVALADSGSTKAQEVLGLQYLDGDGIAINEAEGAKWLERAADRGEAVAAYRLGTLYERGHGVTADAAKAVQWYAVAAKAGNRKAMHNLAVAYAQGSGIQKDMALAAQWFSRAANLGLADSQFNLAVLYERGLGVQQSLGRAYKWYSVAAAQGDAESRTRMEAIVSQLNANDKAAAEKSAAQFQPAALDPAANAPPVGASVLGGT